MDRSAMHYRKQRGWTNQQIAEFTGHHRDTVARVLRESIEKEPARRQRRALAAAFEPQIQQWLDERLSVQRMIELARADTAHPFTGSDVAFYNFVRPLRKARQTLPAMAVVRFEGLPGELLQIDWGEQRQMKFSKPTLIGQTRYFFAARLKYRRYMWVRFTHDMQSETLLRCLIACLVDLGGVPWVVTSDNPKTITLGRDAQHQPVLHPAYQKLAVEFRFYPTLCTPAAANQKGAVENLGTFVKGNFLAGRTFYDDADLAQECAAWVRRVNEERLSDATDQLPAALLAEERPRFQSLPVTADDYGIFDSVMVNRESVVTIETNRYSVPVRLIGQALTARLHAERIALYQGVELVASHQRHRGRGARIVIPEHYEPVFAIKPRARPMLYRDWLSGLAVPVAEYVGELCRKRYDEMESQIAALYALAREVGTEAFHVAVERALAKEAVGVEYVRSFLAAQPAHQPALVDEKRPLLPHRDLGPTQREVERDLAFYEGYVANRDVLLAGALTEGGAR